jgi:putative ABC transport system permease protein
MLAADNVVGSEPIILVSHSFWERRLQSDRNVVGQTIALNGRPRTIVGVLPPGFHPPGELDADVWANNYFDETDTRGSRYLRAIARLRPDVSVEQANTQLATLSIQLEREYPDNNRGMTARVVPLRDRLVGDVRGPVLALFGAAFFVLLIVCANLANLLLARGSARERELSVRAALGADRFRTVRQLLTESAILVVLGGALGVVLAYAVTALLERAAPPVISAYEIAVNGGVLAFTMGLALLVTLLVGVIPALRGAQYDAQQVLKDGGRSTASGRRMRTRGVLVAAQLGLALTLLVGTGLLIRSLARLDRIDPGVRADNVLAMSMNLPAASYPAGREPEFFRELITRVQALQGVRSAAVTSILPFGGSWDRVAFDVEGLPVTAGTDKPEADRYIVSPRYFTTMGIERVAGRLFDESDTYDRPPVAVVDEAFARRIAGDGAALGRRLQLPGRDSLATVVGIVRHVKHYGLDKTSAGQVYMSHEQYPWRWMNLVLHTSVEPLTLGRAVRDVVWSLDRNQPVFGITTMDALMAERAAVRRFVVALLGAFAAIALLVAAVGLYGVIAYTVAQRRQEIGIRLALGARSAQVVRMVLRDALALALAGAAVGLAAAMMGARLLRGLLFEVGTADPAVLAAVTAVLLAVALLASYVPARRAARVSALQSLRSG